MNRKFQIAFWTITYVALILLFGPSYAGYAQSFYFVSFLFPVILGTSLFYNSFLVPRFLLPKKYFRFILYSFYTLVFSVYLEILVITVALVVFANYQFDQLNPITTDILLLTLLMYVLVFINTIIVLLQEYLRGQDRNKELETEQEKWIKGTLLVRSGRKQIQLEYEHILYIESVGNYIRIACKSGNHVMTKEKIGTIQVKLPNNFVRIHRSIVVNAGHITSYNREQVSINELELPISRKYKTAALSRLVSS